MSSDAFDEKFNASKLADDRMEIELSEFWSRVVRSGVLDAPQCQALADSYRKSNDGNRPTQASEIARFLVKRKILTPFQSSVFLAQQPVELRLGPYVIRDPQASSPLGRFAQAMRTTDGAVGAMLRTGPGNPWLSMHTAIDAANLQPLTAEIIGDYEVVFSAVGEGEVLSQVLSDQSSARKSDQPWSPHLVVSLGIKIANAMSAMHNADITHAAIRSDRIWMRSDGEAILLRDPSGPPQPGSLHQDPNQGESNTDGGWLETIDDPSLYLAPELVQGEVNSGPLLPTPSSDIYSLGCVLFRLASGRYPVRGKSPEQTRALHATEVPKELEAAIELGEKGDPLYRVLAYAMAKSPESRFANGTQLAAALMAVGESLPPAPAPEKKTVPPQVGRNKPSEVQANPVAPPATKHPTQNIAPTQSGASAQQGVKSEGIKTVGSSKEPLQATPEPQQASPAGDRPLPTRTRRKRKTRAPWVLAGLAGVVVLQTIALTFMDPSQPVVRRRRAEFVPPAVVPRVSNRTVRESVVSDAPVPKQNPQSGSGANPYQVVQDRRLLYVPPLHAPSTGANPITLDLLPPGPAMVVSVRLAEIRRSVVGQSMLEVFSPELQTLVDSMVTRLGVPVDTVSRVTAGFYSGNRSGQIQAAFSVTLSQPQPMATLLKAWDVSSARTREGQAIYVGDEPNSDAFYLPLEQAEAKQISRFGVGSIDLISELASIDGEPIPLPRSSKSLWDATNRDAGFYMLATSNFLFADGRSLLQQVMPQAIDPLQRLLIPSTSSVLLVAETPLPSDDSQQFYSEIRFSASGGITEASLAQLVGKTIEQWPQWASEFSTAARPDGSWQPLAQRLPSMIKFVASRIRVGVADRTAVANLYLPSVAVPQISLGTVLAMNTPLGGTAAGDQPDGELLTIDQILDRPMSVSFGQESLEFAIDAIKDSLGQQLPTGNKVPVIRIIGGDLQLMGITQNQQIRDFTKEDLPLRQVLTELVVAANPDKSATGPADLKQSLIWVVAGEEDGQQIVVTTRQAAIKKEYELPPEFKP